MKATKTITKLERSKCNFMFYKTSGVTGMYCPQVRHYWFCIPYLIGFRYTETWGSWF